MRARGGRLLLLSAGSLLAAHCGEAEPGVSVAETSASLGLADCGGASASASIHLSSASDFPLTWSAAFEGPYTTTGPVSGTIAGLASESIPIVARFPAFVPSGTVIPGTLIITTNDPEHPVVRIPLTATSYGAELHAEATSFGDIPVTASSPTLPVLLKNTGNAPVDVELGTPSRPEFIPVTPGVHLEPGWCRPHEPRFARLRPRGLRYERAAEEGHRREHRGCCVRLHCDARQWPL